MYFGNLIHANYFIFLVFNLEMTVVSIEKFKQGQFRSNELKIYLSITIIVEIQNLFLLIAEKHIRLYYNTNMLIFII